MREEGASDTSEPNTTMNTGTNVTTSYTTPIMSSNAGSGNRRSVRFSAEEEHRLRLWTLLYGILPPHLVDWTLPLDYAQLENNQQI